MLKLLLGCVMGEYWNSASFSGSFSQTVSYIDHLNLVTAVADLKKAWIFMTFIVILNDEHIVTKYFWEDGNLPVLKDHLSQETTFGPCKLTHQGYASTSLTFNSILIHHSTVLLIWDFDYSHTPPPPPLPTHTHTHTHARMHYEWNWVKVLKIFKHFLRKLNEVYCMLFCSCKRIIA